MKIPIIIFGILILLAPVANSEEDAFTLLGVEIPTAINRDWLLHSDSILYTRRPLSFELQFFVSERGEVDSFKTVGVDSSSYIEAISNSLKNIQFYPARYQGQVIPFVIPARLTFYSHVSGMQVEIRFPYEEPECLKRRFQLENMLELNGFSIPGIVNFPSYFISMEKAREKSDYPFAVVEAAIDSAGKLIDFEILNTYGRDFSRIIKNSLLYAEFTAAEYKGVGFDSRLYVLFRFFSSVQYPTVDWPPENLPGLNLPFEYLRIEPRLYLDSIINPPIPLNFPGGLFKHDSNIPFIDSAEVVINIDRDGELRSFRILSFVSSEIENFAKEIVKKLKFIPARDLSNNRINFKGTLRLEFAAGSFVHIWVDWLPPSAQGRRP